MAISFKWSVSNLRVIPQQGDKSNVVSVVEWLVQGTDDVNLITASASGIRSFVLGDTFTPFDQLTENQVLDWCFEPETITWIDRDDVEQSVTKHLKEEGEAQVTGQIERQLAKKVLEPALPWAA
jgi:hypothetical protein